MNPLASLRRRASVPRPKQGELRVWNIINPPNEGDKYPVTGLEHAKTLIDALAQSQLLEPRITSNVFGLEVFEDGEWSEWEDENGYGIDEWEPELSPILQVVEELVEDAEKASNPSSRLFNYDKAKAALLKAKGESA